MARDGYQDPFEGLRLDDSFVRGARFIEPSADERAVTHGEVRPGHCRVQPAHRGVPGAFNRWMWAPYSPRGRRATRFVALVTLLAGVAGLGLFLLRHGGPRTAVVSAPAPSAGIPARAQDRATVDGPDASPATTPATSPAGPVPGGGQRFGVDAALLAALREGDCLLWTPDPAHAVVPIRVSCDQSHVDQVTRVINLAGPFPVWPAWPGSDGLATATLTNCPDAARNLLGSTGMATDMKIASIYPEEAEWLAGAHGLVCTIRPDDLRPRVGPVRAVGVSA
ncbi:septum formation family protein [Frankia sp. Cr1]|uniref:septum formation family protein n=1 Tax=Frankia sp. Cr1 TaxID=3073931 RepID=UPI002AD4A535|nr:septum formation family protein [Frankia sp. Cr1]